jgi:bifunctional non-homologous end joining protein LigD
MQLAPMLATAAEPFDSPDYLFEIKWDGVRALAACETAGWQLWGRGTGCYTDRYPELDVLRQLPAGTILDGELVRLNEGRADFSQVLRRHQLAGGRKIRWAAAREPVTYMVFDLLNLGDKCLLKEPLATRRDRLEELWSGFESPYCQLSHTTQGLGKDFFERTVEQGHEGVMAKRLDSRYCPGQRSPAWRKIKPREDTVGVIIGYRMRADRSLSALLVAADNGRGLRYVGEIRCGFGRIAHRLAPLLVERRCATPCVPCWKQVQWVRPELYCRARCFGRTASGRWRFPYFVDLLDG